MYIEQINPDNPEEYLTPDGYKPFKTQDVLIRVKDQAPRTVKMRWTQNGPVIPGDHYGLQSITPQGHVTSIRWAALDANDQSMTAAINMMRAKSISAARAAMAFYKAPSQNVTLADKNGVMLQMVGKQPRRNTAHRSLGRFPSRGWVKENRWDGYLPFEDNPGARDPASGIVANTNNKITDAPFPRHVSHSWGDTYRYLRLTSLMNAREVHTRDSFIEAQLDTGSVGATALLPLVAKELWFTGEAAEAGTSERQRQIALELLAAWNGQMDEHIPESLIYAAWMRQLQNRLIRDDLANLSEHFPRPDPVFLERVFRNIEGAGSWCDIKQSTRPETCADIARKSTTQEYARPSAPFPRHVSHSWGDTYRYLRLTSLMNAREVHTRDSFIEAQLDTGSVGATALLPLVAKELWFTGEAAEAGTSERQRQIALELLAAWNGQMDEHIPESLIYAAWMRQLQNRLIRDDLANLSEHFPRPDPVFLERVFRNIEGAGSWCDIKQSTRPETCADIARMSLDAAILELTELYGDRIDSWRWGEAHQAHHDHEVLGKVPLLAWFANIRQDTSGGDHTLMRARTSGTGDAPYANVHAAGFRSVIDFSDPDSSVYIISTGQSGHFLSRHYDDLAQLWRRGEYILMSLDPDLARGGAVGISQLSPAE
ncbi:penicillin acylase family protein [Amylibacter sp.]|nr:penicillin acylase family protein [Amylibacter sp.]